MIFSFVVAALTFGSGFVALIIDPNLWWVALGIGVSGSLLFARWYSGSSRKSFFICAGSSVLFSSAAYLYALLIDPDYLFLYAVICVCILARWKMVWYVYSFDKDRYELLSIPKMSVWFLVLALTIACADVWGYRLYFGYTYVISIIICGGLGLMTGILILTVLKYDLKGRFLVFACFLLMYVELVTVTSFLPAVPMAQALISSTGFLFIIQVIRVLDRPIERSASGLVKVGLITVFSILLILAILPIK